MAKDNSELIDANSDEKDRVMEASHIQSLIYVIRGKQVMLDSDLAILYQVETKTFNQAVKRNIERFQNDMMFQLSDNEVEYLRSQFVTANISSKSRSNPYVFTEQGVYMLMTVLKGELAVRQSIALVRTPDITIIARIP